MTSLEKLLNGSGLGKVWKTSFECVKKITGNVNFEEDGNLQEQISELSSKTIHVDANQSLTDAQKTTARNNIGVGEASKKGVDISISAASKSTNLPTSAAVASFVEGKGYKTTDTWRGIQNNLTSDSTTDSLSAAQGKALANGSARDNTKLSSSGDSKNCTATFTSGDSNNATNWTDVGLLTSGEKHSSMLQKIATMFKNVRYLYHMLGTADISTLGDGADIGTVTGAISKLNSDLEISYFNRNIITDANTAIRPGLNGLLDENTVNGIQGVIAYCFCMGLAPYSSLVQIAIGYRAYLESERYIWIRTRFADKEENWTDWYKIELVA